MIRALNEREFGDRGAVIKRADRWYLRLWYAVHELVTIRPDSARSYLDDVIGRRFVVFNERAVCRELLAYKTLEIVPVRGAIRRLDVNLKT